MATNKPAPDYSDINIIYNPKSTGEAPQKARRLYRRLKRQLPAIPIKLIQTEYAGHAIKLAYDIGMHGSRPLIVSVSGDGGYNEVINGALRAQAEGGARAICAVYGAGNANDHRRTLKENPLPRAIVEGKVREIDLLKVDIRSGRKKPVVLYAHSYIGLGFTPAVATELNRHRLNRWRETALVFKTLLRFKPFHIEVDGRRHQFDSLVFANIHQMAKVLTISKGGRPDDGQFEVIELPHKRRAAIVLTATKAAISGLGPQPRRTRYTFKPLEDLPMQLDGELRELRREDRVVVSSAPHALQTIL